MQDLFKVGSSESKNKFFSVIRNFVIYHQEIYGTDLVQPYGVLRRVDIIRELAEIKPERREGIPSRSRHQYDMEKEQAVSNIPMIP